MRKQLTKGLLYSAAPRLAFAARHPKKAAAGKWTTRAISRPGHGSPRRSSHNGLIGLGAAALALPIGMLIGRRMNRSGSRPGASGF